MFQTKGNALLSKDFFMKIKFCIIHENKILVKIFIFSKLLKDYNLNDHEILRM